MPMTDLDTLGIDPEELAKMRAFYALRRLSREVQNDVLSDGTIAQKFNVNVSHPVELSGGVTVERKLIFDCIRRACGGETVTLDIQDAKGNSVKLEVTIDDKDALVRYPSHLVRFQDAALLTTQADRRKAIGDICLQRRGLCEAQRQLFYDLIKKSEFEDDDLFAALNILSAAPEAFAERLHASAKTGTLAADDFVPAEASYWENLVTPWRESACLLEFIDNELAVERQSIIARDPEGAFERISLSFGAAELVPRDAFSALDTDVVLRSVEAVRGSGDPFALAGAFDICVDRIGDDPRFIVAGDAILADLISEPERLARRFVPYAAGFIFAIGFLAKHQIHSRLPAYWRRINAATHAALVTRVLGEGENGDNSLIQFALRMFANEYFLATARESDSQPRWWPDWIDPRILAADLYGRLAGSLARLSPEQIPQKWEQSLETAKAWVIGEGLFMATMFPSVLQGALVVVGDEPPAGTPVAEMYDALEREVTVESLLKLRPIIATFGFSIHARQAVLKIVHALRSETKTVDDDSVNHALRLAANISVLSQDSELGEVVSQTSVEWAAINDAISVLEVVANILICACSLADREVARSVIARRLENLAFVVPSEKLYELHDVLRSLCELDRCLAKRLGRALATARLGQSQTS